MKSLIVSATRRRRDIKIPLCVGPRMVKYIVSDKYGHTQKCNLSVLDLKIPFLSKFGPKNQD